MRETDKKLFIAALGILGALLVVVSSFWVAVMLGFPFVLFLLGLGMYFTAVKLDS